MNPYLPLPLADLLSQGLMLMTVFSPCATLSFYISFDISSTIFFCVYLPPQRYRPHLKFTRDFTLFPEEPRISLSNQHHHTIPIHTTALAFPP